MIIGAYVKDIVTGSIYALCPDCHEHITGYLDPEGAWIECGCDAGYTISARITVEVIES